MTTFWRRPNSSFISLGLGGGWKCKPCQRVLRVCQIGGSPHCGKGVLGLRKVLVTCNDVALSGGQLAPCEVRATELPACPQGVEDVQGLLQPLLGCRIFACQSMCHPPGAVRNGLIEQMPILERQFFQQRSIAAQGRFIALLGSSIGQDGIQIVVADPFALRVPSQLDGLRCEGELALGQKRQTSSVMPRPLPLCGWNCVDHGVE